MIDMSKPTRWIWADVAVRQIADTATAAARAAADTAAAADEDAAWRIWLTALDRVLEKTT